MQWHHWLLFAALVFGGGALARVYARPWQAVGLP